ncbi:MAG TPA: hypothetical protein VJO14_01625, partial [Bacteroidota bacterium]|nr:hypothetical protein [Bacteroidota bacterium]
MTLETTLLHLKRASPSFVGGAAIITLILASGATVPASGAGDAQQRSAVSPIQRAMEANEQMREYRQRVELDKNTLNSLSAAKQNVGIQLNDAS